MKGCVWLVAVGVLCFMGCSGDGSGGADPGWNPPEDVVAGTDIPAGVDGPIWTENVWTDIPMVVIDYGVGKDVPIGTDIANQDVGNKPDPGTIVPIESALYESGIRIKAKVYKTADGAVSFAGWHDTELDVDCSFKEAHDGKYRCVPPILITAYFFKDSACSEPVFVWSDCPYYSEFEWLSYCPSADSCGWGLDCGYYEKGEPYLGIYYQWVNQVTEGQQEKVCKEMGELGPNAIYVGLGKEIPASTFQEASVEIMEP